MSDQTNTPPKNNGSGKIISMIPQLLEQRQWSPEDLHYYTRQAGAPISRSICYELAKGATSFNLSTLEKLCTVLEEDITAVIQFQPAAAG